MYAVAFCMKRKPFYCDSICCKLLTSYFQYWILDKSIKVFSILYLIHVPDLYRSFHAMPFLRTPQIHYYKWISYSVKWQTHTYKACIFKFQTPQTKGNMSFWRFLVFDTWSPCVCFSFVAFPEKNLVSIGKWPTVRIFLLYHKPIVIIIWTFYESNYTDWICCGMSRQLFRWIIKCYFLLHFAELSQQRNSFFQTVVYRA